MKVEMPKDQLRLLNRATLIPILLIFFLASLLVSIQNHIIKINHLLDETDDTLRQARITQTYLSQMESNYNSYIVTRREEFLHNYLLARNELPENLTRLEELSLENKGIKQFNGISRAFKSWVVHSESLFGKPVKDGVRIFESTEFQRVGNMYLNGLRTAFEKFITRQLKVRDDQLKQTTRTRRTLLSVGAALSLLIAVFLAWYFRNRLKKEFLKYETQARHLRESREELKTSLKQREDALKSRDEFIKIASHELNTPLQSLLLQAQMLKRGLELNGTLPASKLTSHLGKEVTQINRLTHLVQDMLAITRLGKGVIRLNRSKIKLNQIINDVLHDLSELISASHSELHLDLEDSIQGNWDKERLEQVLSNLVTNALKYGRGKPISIRTSLDNNWARIEVEDQGFGIPEESNKRIFERFERDISSSEVSGLGVGLFISREFINSHGGKIWAESAGANLGSVFVVELPLSMENNSDSTELFSDFPGQKDLTFSQDHH